MEKKEPKKIFKKKTIEIFLEIKKQNRLRRWWGGMGGGALKYRRSLIGWPLGNQCAVSLLLLLLLWLLLLLLLLLVVEREEDGIEWPLNDSSNQWGH